MKVRPTPISIESCSRLHPADFGKFEGCFRRMKAAGDSGTKEVPEIDGACMVSARCHWVVKIQTAGQGRMQ